MAFLNPFAVIKKTAESLGSVFSWVFTISLVTVSAIAVYMGFYMLYVPAKLHVKPVHFQFQDISYTSDGKSNDIPHATVTLKDDDPGEKSVTDRILSRGQRYTVSLILNVPLSDENKKVGMFMTELTFFEKQGKNVGKSSRPALIPYTSPVVSTFSSLIDFFFLYWRWKQESDKLNIVLFENFIDDSYSPAEYAEIKIFSKTIQIYSAELHIEAVFSGIRYYMFYWPLSTAVFGIFSNLLLGIIIAIWLYFKFCKDYGTDDESEESFEIDDINESFFNTDTESATGANPAEISGVQGRGSSESQASNNVARGSIRHPSRTRIRHVPLRRLANMQSRTQIERTTNEGFRSLTRRFTPAKITTDASCQTDEPVDHFL